MLPKKIALLLAFPLVVGIGWALRSAFEPGADAPGEAAETSAPEEALEELAGLDASAGEAEDADDAEVASSEAADQKAGAKNAPKPGPKGAEPKGGKAKGGKAAGANGKNGAAEPAGKAQKGTGAKATGAPTNVPLVPLTLVLLDGPGGEPITDARVFLSATDTGEQSERLAQWARGPGANADQKAAFGDEGLAVDETGTVKVEVPTSVALRVDVKGPGIDGEHRVTALRALKASMTRPREIDVSATQLASRLAGAEAGGATKGAAERGPAVAAAESTPSDYFHAKLVAGADRAPVHGASVLFGEKEIARSDEDGRFSLAFDPALSPVLQVVMPGFAPAIVQAKLGHHYPERAQVVELQPGASIAARILTAEGDAASGTQVVLTTDMASVLGSGSEEGAPRLGELTWTATANRLGMVFFESLPTDARLSIGLRRPGQRGTELQRGVGSIPPFVTLAPNEVWDPEWRLPGRPEIAGRAVDQDGEPLANASVWLVALGESEPPIARYLRPEETPAEETTTDAQGRFRFVDIDPVAWLVGLAPERPETQAAWQTALGSLAVPALAGDLSAPANAELLIVASRGLTIRGVVLGPGGHPAGGALVTALEESGHGALEVRARSDGGFVLGPLSAGRFALLVSGCEGSGVERFGPFQAGSREVLLALRAARRFSGNVVSASGEPRAAGLAVFEDGALCAQIDTESGLQPGAFQVALPPGMYDFVATTADGQVGALRSVAIGDDTLSSGFTVAVDRGALVSATYRGEHPWRHVSYFHDGRLFATGLLHAGVRRGQFVPAGRILVRVQTALGEPALEREFEISAGTRMDVELGGVESAPPVEDAPQPEPEVVPGGEGGSSAGSH